MPTLLLSSFLLRREFPVTLGAVLVSTLALMLSIEKLVVRGSGIPPQDWARWLTGLPAFLLLLVVNSPAIHSWNGAGQFEILFWLLILLVAEMPWIVTMGEGRRLRLWMVISIWGLYVLYFFLYGIMWQWTFRQLGASH